MADTGFVLFLVLCLVLAIWSVRYHGARLKADAVQAHARLVDVQTRQGVEHFSQTLMTVNLLLGSLLESGIAERSASEWQRVLEDGLRNAPHLRSLALLDDHDRVVVSTHADDLGLRPGFDAYLPRVGRYSDLLRVGPPFEGRNLADGREIDGWCGAQPAISFVPVVRSLSVGEGGRLSLLAVLNVDYFLNRLMQIGEASGIDFDVMRFDGRLLFSTCRERHSEALRARNALLSERWQSGVESGVLSGALSDEPGDAIVAHRLDPNLPVGIVGWMSREEAIAQALVEMRWQQWVLLPLLGMVLVGVLLAYLFLRRAGQRERLAQYDALERYGRLLDALPASVLLFDAGARLSLSNQSWRRAVVMHGAMDRHDAITDVASFAGLFAPMEGACGQAGSLLQGMLDVLNGRELAFDGEYRLAPGGASRCCHLMVRRFDPGTQSGIAVMVRDITRQREAQSEVELLRSAVNAAGVAVVVTNDDAVIEWANPAFTELTGYTVEEALGRKPKELVSSGLQNRTFYETLWATILSGRVWRGELVNRRKDGRFYDEALTIAPVADAAGHIHHFVAIKDDITHRKQLEAQLRVLATTDALTGLANRRAFMEALQRELGRHHRHGRALGVMMLDIDHFKCINDTYGHAAGDCVLQAVAGVMRQSVRTADVVGRIGGEEFALITPETDATGTRELAERIRLAVAALEVGCGHHSIGVTVSIGLAQARPGDGPESVLSRADAALYAAKEGGRNRVCEETAQAPAPG